MLCAKLRSAVSQVSADSTHTFSFGHVFLKELFFTLRLHTFSLLTRLCVHDKCLEYPLYIAQAYLCGHWQHLSDMVPGTAAQDWSGVVILKASKPVLKVKSVKLRA